MLMFLFSIGMSLDGGVRLRHVEVASDLGVTVHELRSPGPLVQQFISGGLNTPIADPFGTVLWPGAHLAAKLMATHRDRIAGRRVLCLGTGTGLEALAAAQLGAAEVVACDVNPLVLSLLSDAAEAAGVSSAVRTHQIDLCSGAELPRGEFDVCVCADTFYSAELAGCIGRRAAAACLLVDTPQRPGPWLIICDSQVFSDTWPAFEDALGLGRFGAALPEFRLATLPSLTGSGILIEDDVTSDALVRYLSLQLDVEPHAQPGARRISIHEDEWSGS